jgi:hypothetical protein
MTDQTWRKSSFSGSQAQCVEVADAASAVMVRDTQDPDGGTLALSADAWRAFTSKIKSALREAPSRADLSGVRPLTCSARNAPVRSPAPH